MSSDGQQGTGSLIVGLLLGAIAGAVVGLWQARESGSDLRRGLLARGDTLRASVEEQLVGERIEDAVAEGRAVAQQRQIELSLE